jgi:predicted 3-demethylubiquinone-9 3-methyltransferase (glyoxalase superfamily)
MNNSIYPCITIKNRISEASDFYRNTFEEAKILHTSQWVIQLELSGQKFMLLNEGPSSTPNPSISFMVMTRSAEETERYWNKLMEGGSALMALDTYPWSSKYGWLQDKYGVSWQLYTSDQNNIPQKICPTLMFTGANAGKATEAINYYTSIFPQSRIEGILNYSAEDGENTDFVKHAQFTIKDFVIMAMDSSLQHGFSFNDATSLVVECETQTEIDTYWDKLTSEGGQEVACGWLTDKYGISWQIIPKVLGKLMTDPQRAPRAMNALMQMKKLIIADLENA